MVAPSGPLTFAIAKGVRSMTIAVCNHRTAPVYTNKEIPWDEFCDRCRNPRRGPETMEEYLQLPKTKQTEKKDVGGFVGGTLRDGVRKKGNVLSRCMLTLDMDDATPDTWNQIKARGNFRCLVYSTRKHTPDKPRLRLVVLLARVVTPEEYEAISRKLAELIGMEVFDPTTFQPERLMFWPSTCSDGEFFFDHMDGPPLDPDEYLAMHDDWQDASTWPQHPQQSRKPLVGSRTACPNDIAHNPAAAQADPLTKPGIVGAFCRAYYPIQKGLETFLPDVYAPSAGGNRYEYIPADSAPGVLVYDDRFIYSYHATDPACNILLSIFDSVRIHMFSHLDAGCPPNLPMEQRPSFKAMLEFARNDAKTKALLEEEQRAQVIDAFDVIDDPEDDDVGNNGGSGDTGNGGNGSNGGNNNGGGNSGNTGGGNGGGGSSWANKLERDKNGNIKPTLPNLLLILKHDPLLQPIVYNRMRDTFEIRGKVPWSHPSAHWRDADDAQLTSYVNVKYAPFSAHQCNIALSKTADDRSYHPIEDYIEGLPDWDGVPRVDTLLVDYLGAENSEYIRAVTRKTLCAAIQRIRQPGCKFDYVLTLAGPQGIGKSTLIAKLAGEWFSDSLCFNDMKDKTAAEKLQGVWIMEVGELVGIRQVDAGTIRRFLSSQDDRYRAAFAKRATSHPRQCIFIATTNDATGFLQDTTGNRRFWPVKTPGSGTKDPRALTEEEVRQIWAEALIYADSGEELYLDSNLETTANDAQREAIEHDEREGLVEEYLKAILQAGTTTVCPLEIWCTCFGQERGKIKKSDSRDIAAILVRLNWQKADKKVRTASYGPQYVYTPKP